MCLISYQGPIPISGMEKHHEWDSLFSSNERAGDGGCSHIDEVIFVALLMQGSGGGVGSRVEHTGYSFVHKDNQISPEGRDPRSIYYGWS